MLSPSASDLHVKRFTLTSKPNWWCASLILVQHHFSLVCFQWSKSARTVQKRAVNQTRPSTTIRFNRPTRPHTTTSRPSTTQTSFSNFQPLLHTLHLPILPPTSHHMRPDPHLNSFSALSRSQRSPRWRSTANCSPTCLMSGRSSLLSSESTGTVTRHRNIVAFLGCLENLGMVLEFVQGSPLLDFIRDHSRPLERSDKVSFHNQILSGISHVHSFGLSHGDLSLLNVHVTSSLPYTLKILDFGRSVATSAFLDPEMPRETSFIPGLRRSMSSMPMTPGPMLEDIHPGTRPFTAPEILRGECRDPILADAYSFGIILLCLDLNNLVDMEPRVSDEGFTSGHLRLRDLHRKDPMVHHSLEGEKVG